jgi:dipeptidase E
MGKVILFSNPHEKVIDEIPSHLFPNDFSNKKFAYMPSDGAVNKEKYTNFWAELAEENGYELIYINNSLEGDDAQEEIKKMMGCSVLLITGGNTYHLLRNLKRSGMDGAVIEFINREDSVFSGFSAGAIVVTPRIDIVGIGDDCDVNEVGLKDLSALGIVDYEIYPHFSEGYQEDIDTYKKKNPGVEVKKLRDDEYIIENI